jgi:hypothetical protein
MSSRHPLPQLLLALVALLSLQLGGDCGGGYVDPDSPPAMLHVQPGKVFYFSGGYFLRVDVSVTTSEPFQAWDLTLEWNTDVLEELGSQPHADFDDDGSFFGEEQVDQGAGRANLVDLRHGGEGASGTVYVARTWFIARSGGAADVHVHGEVASGDGLAFEIFVQKPRAFPFTP